MDGRELRRCRTQVDFKGRGDRNQVRTSKKFIMPTNRMKFPTLEIYRPPGDAEAAVSMFGGTSPRVKKSCQRMMEGAAKREGEEDEKGGGGRSSRLNVHAKEFVMSDNHLQTSKSTGNILSESRRKQYRQAPQPDHQDKGRIGTQHEDLRNTREGREMTGARIKEGSELRRSKSLYVPSSASNNASTVNNNNTINNLTNKIGGFSMSVNQHLPPELKQIILKAQGDVTEYSLGELAQLARSLVLRAEEDRCYAERLAETCLTVIEREPHSTFLEALTNSLIFSLEKKQMDPTKESCYPLLAFLSHLYTLFKTMGKTTDSRFRMGSNPSLQMLHLLAQTCICTLKNPNLTVRNEIECLFFVVTTIGRELEQEFGKVLEEMMDCIRDALYLNNTTERIRRTLLQMLEIHAAKWQIPAESLSFYQAATE